MIYHDCKINCNHGISWSLLHLLDLCCWIFVAYAVVFLHFSSVIHGPIQSNLIWDIYSGLNRKKTIARSTRVSRWRPEKIAETRMLSDVAGMSTDWADVTSLGRLLHIRGAATGKARLPTDDSLTCGTIRQSVLAERVSTTRHIGNTDWGLR